MSKSSNKSQGVAKPILLSIWTDSLITTQELVAFGDVKVGVYTVAAPLDTRFSGDKLAVCFRRGLEGKALLPAVIGSFQSDLFKVVSVYIGRTAPEGHAKYDHVVVRTGGDFIVAWKTIVEKYLIANLAFIGITLNGEPVKRAERGSPRINQVPERDSNGTGIVPPGGLLTPGQFRTDSMGGASSPKRLPRKKTSAEDVTNLLPEEPLSGKKPKSKPGEVVGGGGTAQTVQGQKKSGLSSPLSGPKPVIAKPTESGVDKANNTTLESEMYKMDDAAYAKEFLAAYTNSLMGGNYIAGLSKPMWKRMLRAYKSHGTGGPEQIARISADAIAIRARGSVAK